MSETPDPSTGPSASSDMAADVVITADTFMAEEQNWVHGKFLFVPSLLQCRLILSRLRVADPSQITEFFHRNPVLKKPIRELWMSTSSVPAAAAAASAGAPSTVSSSPVHQRPSSYSFSSPVRSSTPPASSSSTTPQLRPPTPPMQRAQQQFQYNPPTPLSTVPASPLPPRTLSPPIQAPLPSTPIHPSHPQSIPFTPIPLLSSPAVITASSPSFASAPAPSPAPSPAPTVASPQHLHAILSALCSMQGLAPPTIHLLQTLNSNTILMTKLMSTFGISSIQDRTVMMQAILNPSFLKAATLAHQALTSAMAQMKAATGGNPAANAAAMQAAANTVVQFAYASLAAQPGSLPIPGVAPGTAAPMSTPAAMSMSAAAASLPQMPRPMVAPSPSSAQKRKFEQTQQQQMQQHQQHQLVLQQQQAVREREMQIQREKELKEQEEQAAILRHKLMYTIQEVPDYKTSFSSLDDISARLSYFEAFSEIEPYNQPAKAEERSSSSSSSPPPIPPETIPRKEFEESYRPIMESLGTRFVETSSRANKARKSVIQSLPRYPEVEKFLSKDAVPHTDHLFIDNVLLEQEKIGLEKLKGEVAQLKQYMQAALQPGHAQMLPRPASPTGSAMTILNGMQ